MPWHDLMNTEDTVLNKSASEHTELPSSSATVRFPPWLSSSKCCLPACNPHWRYPAARRVMDDPRGTETKRAAGLWTSWCYGTAPTVCLAFVLEYTNQTGTVRSPNIKKGRCKTDRKLLSFLSSLAPFLSFFLSSNFSTFFISGPSYNQTLILWLDFRLLRKQVWILISSRTPLCSLLETDISEVHTDCTTVIGLIGGEEETEMSFNMYHTTRSNNPEHTHLQTLLLLLQCMRQCTCIFLHFQTHVRI